MPSQVWLKPFSSRNFLRNGHLQTLAGNFLPRNLVLPEPERLLVEVDGPVAGYGPSYVLCHCHWQPEEVRAQRLTLVLVHGLEGSSSSQYMIGNTDFAVSVLHNIVLIRDTAGVVYPVPYDFDWSGVIWTPYAQPDPRLGIRTVRDRIFRGTCRTPEELAALFVPFNQQKDTVYALYRGMEAQGLEHKRVEQALDYYDDFYKTINDQGRMRREFIRACHES